MRLEGKVGIVTGGARGMGEAEAMLFASEGAKVVIADLQDAAGQAVADAINASGGEAVFSHLNVTDEKNWEAVVADAVGQNCEYIQAGQSGILVPAEDDTAFSQALLGKIFFRSWRHRYRLFD